MKKTIYYVWYQSGDGDIFKGYQNTLASTHLDKSVANEVARMNSGWVETEEDDLHTDYIEQLERQDADLKANQLIIRTKAREMLSYGG